VSVSPTDAYSRGQRLRSLTAVIGSATVAGFTFGLTMPLLSLVLEGRGIESTWIGLNAAVSSLAILLIGPLVPRILERLGVLRALYLSAGASVVLLLMLPLFPSLWAWFVLRFLLGAAAAAHWIGSETWIMTMTGRHNRGRIIAIYMTFMSAGFAAGPLLIQVVGIEGWAPFVVGAAMIGATTLPLLIARGCAPSLPPRPPAAFLNIFRVAPLILAAAVLGGITDMAQLSLFPVYLLRSGFDQETAVAMLSAILWGNVLLQIPIGWLADRVDRRRMLIGFVVVMLVVPLVFDLMLASPWLLWPGLVVWGGVCFGIYTIGLTLLGDRFPAASLASANAAFVTVFEVGGLSGPILAGSAIDLLPGPGFMIVLAGSAALFLALAVWRGFTRPEAPGGPG
jgi:MFS family permease